MIRRIVYSLVFLIGTNAAHAQLLDLGDPISLDDQSAPVETVSEGLSLDVATEALQANTPVQVAVDGVFFIPVSTAAAGQLWTVSVDAPPRTRVGIGMAQFQREDGGKIADITYVDSAGDVRPPFAIAIPTVTEYLEIATSGPATVTLTPRAPVAVSDVAVGQTAGLQLQGFVEIPLTYDLPGTRENLRAIMDLPANIDLAIAMRVAGQELLHHVDDGQPVAADLAVERLVLRFSRANAFADDPWPVLPLTLDLAPIATDEVEPNQDLPTATLVDWPADARRARVDGRIAGSNAFDLWRFEHDGVRAVDISFEAESGVSTLALLDPEGTALTNTAGAGALEIAPLVLPAGTYFLKVESNAARLTDYTIKFRRIRLPDSDEVAEPNDMIAASHPITVDQTVSGTLSDRDIDHVTFDVLTQGQMWGAVSPGDLTMTLLATNGGEIARSKPDRTTRVQRLPAVALPVGTYVIALQGEGAYDVTLRNLGPVPDDWEVEPNNSTHQANFLGVGQQMRGQSSDGDTDQIYFTVPEAQYVGLRLQAPDDATVNVDLHMFGSRVFSETRLTPGTGFDQVYWLDAGEYTLSLGRWGDGVSQDAWTVQLYTPDPGTFSEIEPNGDTYQRVLHGQRITGSEDGLDFRDGFSVALPDMPGRAYYGCNEIGSWQDFAVGPFDARGAEVDSDRATRDPEKR
ncbi:MAG: hypothetical protein AAGF56_01190, partial [Pseudomonadota bacterium]